MVEFWNGGVLEWWNVGKQSTRYFPGDKEYDPVFDLVMMEGGVRGFLVEAEVTLVFI